MTYFFTGFMSIPKDYFSITILQKTYSFSLLYKDFSSNLHTSGNKKFYQKIFCLSTKKDGLNKNSQPSFRIISYNILSIVLVNFLKQYNTLYSVRLSANIERI